MFSERTSRVLLIFGMIVFVLGIILFLWKDSVFDPNLSIDSQKFSDFGSFVGGLIGTMWALAGVILFYVALQEQRVDININRNTLQTQVDALKQQIKEFELQRQELELTREVFIEQSQTQKLQQFESTFFNTLHLFYSLIESITYIVPLPPHKLILDDQPDVVKGRDCFQFFFSEFSNSYYHEKVNYVTNSMLQEYDPEKDYNLSKEIHLFIVKNAYKNFFGKMQSDLGHYFRMMYNLVRLINDKKIQHSKYYTNLIRAGLSTYEHLMLFYNVSSDYGEEKFKPLVIDYSLLDNMPQGLLLDKSHLEFFPEKAYK